MHRFTQYSGNLFVPTIVLGELYTWAYTRPSPTRILRLIQNDLLAEVHLLVFDKDCSLMFGQIRGRLLKKGITVDKTDLMIAAVALVHNLTLVTNNTADFNNIPNLRLDDWLLP